MPTECNKSTVTIAELEMGLVYATEIGDSVDRDAIALDLQERARARGDERALHRLATSDVGA